MIPMQLVLIYWLDSFLLYKVMWSPCNDWWLKDQNRWVYNIVIYDALTCINTNLHILHVTTSLILQAYVSFQQVVSWRKHPSPCFPRAQSLTSCLLLSGYICDECHGGKVIFPSYDIMDTRANPWLILDLQIVNNVWLSPWYLRLCQMDAALRKKSEWHEKCDQRVLIVNHK